MLGALTLILLCQLFGELIVAATDITVPGPVCGMVLLFFGLVMNGGIPEGLKDVGDTLLGHLSLLFVPAGVGVMLHAELLARDWLAISIALIASTLLTVAITAAVMTALNRRMARSGNGKDR